MRLRPRRLTAIVSAVATAAAVALAPSSALAAEPTEPPAIRLAGPERVATAIALSRHGWATSEVVVLARADDPADGLTGSAVAGRSGAPLLITPRDRLAGGVASEIRRLGARKAILLGGPAALSHAVAAQVRELGLDVQRLAGPNRAGTAGRVAEWLAPPAGGTAFLVADWSDALAVSATAARDAMAGHPQPILLAGAELPAESRAALRGTAVSRVVIVDGDGRIPPRVEAALRADGLRVERVGGATRYEVSRTLLAGEIDRDPTARPFLLATGEQFPDGLGAGALAARVGGRLMLTSPSAGAARELTWLNARQASISDHLVIGGDAAVPELHVRTLLKRPTTTKGTGGGTTKVTAPSPSAGRSGLHFTPAEVEIWRQRLASGPYRSAGDAGTNTPGDGDRIVRNAAAFVRDPAAAHWSGPSQGSRSTCVQKNDDTPPVEGPAALRDAAFHALVTGDRTAVPAVKRALLAQAREPGTAFSNGSRWCVDVLQDVSPAFQISHWLTKLLFAYDYLGPAEFTAEERRVMDDWFVAGARFLQFDLDDALDGLFVDRQAGDYRLSAQTVKYPWCDRTMYVGSPETCQIHRMYNNRRAAIARHVGLVGLHQDDASLRSSGARFAKEFLAYGLFADGGHADMYRWSDRLPDLGWAYAANTVAPVAVLADTFARAGDPSLYTHRTARGALGSEGGAKDLRFAVTSLGSYVDGSVDRRVTADAATSIDAVHGDWHGLHDVGSAFTNLFYRDDAIRAQYTRTGPGYRGYPAKPASSGPNVVWTGDGGIFPGVLFMFGQLEGQVDPYPTRS